MSTTSDAILDNKELMSAFVGRFKEYKIGYERLVSEMSEDGITMDRKRLQRFVSRGSEKRITQKAYIWLLARHGIGIGLSVTGSQASDMENREKAREFSQTVKEEL